MRPALMLLVCIPLAAATWGESAAYPHLHPKHVALECGSCHALKANEVDIHETPGHTTCSACHNFAEEAVKRSESFCGECHNSPEPSEQNSALSAFPKTHTKQDFGDQFSHVAHKSTGLCTDCHVSIASDGSKQMDIQASHAYCFKCHSENPRGYSAATKATNPSRTDCDVCHVAHVESMPVLPDIAHFRHIDHLFDTRPRMKSAGPVSTVPDRLCIECHDSTAKARHPGDIRAPQNSECATCHTGKPGLPDPLELRP